MRTRRSSRSSHRLKIVELRWRVIVREKNFLEMTSRRLLVFFFKAGVVVQIKTFQDCRFYRNSKYSVLSRSHVSRCGRSSSQISLLSVRMNTTRNMIFSHDLFTWSFCFWLDFSRRRTKALNNRLSSSLASFIKRLSALGLSDTLHTDFGRCKLIRRGSLWEDEAYAAIWKLIEVWNSKFIRRKHKGKWRDSKRRKENMSFYEIDAAT